MNLKSLQIFATIMKKGSLAKAADHHCLSESAASRQISQLEGQIGFSLFSRDKRNLKPTLKGEEFYKEIRRILYGVDGIPDIIEDIKRTDKTQLRVIGIPRLVRHIISPAVANICQDNPDTKVHVDVQAMRTLEKWVAGFQFNIGLGRLPAAHPAIVTRTFCSLPTVVILPLNHPLSKRSELTLSDLDSLPLISLIKDTLLAQNISNLFHAEGRSIRPMIEVASAFHACSIVASGYGYTICDPLAAHSMGDNSVSIVPLKTDFKFEFAFFEPRQFELSEATKLFKNEVALVAEDYCKKYGY